MFRVIVSNRSEALATAWCEHLQAQRLEVLQAEPVVVPSAALRTWLEQMYAQHFSVAANMDFAFPAHWVWRLIARVTNAAGERSPLAQERSLWPILSWLQTPEARKAPRLGDYLQQADACMQFELAGRIAALFERYSSYRPDWLTTWAQGRQPRELQDQAGTAVLQDATWQALAWRVILQAAGIAAEHPIRDLFKLLTAAGAQAAGRYHLPSRLTVFAVPAMPPLYLDIFKSLATWIDITFYMVNPCAAFWFDLETPKQRTRRALRETVLAGAETAHETGNALLGLWGSQTKASMELLLEATDGDLAEAYAIPAADSMLAQLHTAMLEFTDPIPGSLNRDDSIVFHSAHSLTRELEILHDQLLRRFRDDESLRPSDVLVVIPELDAAAALVDGVFGSIAERDPRFIPYRITGVSAHAANMFWRSFSALLQLPLGRAEAPVLLDLLEFAPLARRFELDHDGLETIRRWIAQTGIHWGLDAEHSCSLLVADDAGGWSLDAGLQRLFLGLAMPTDGTADYHGCLPYDDIEGQATMTLARFWRYAQTLRSWRKELDSPRSLQAWCELFATYLERFYAPTSDELAEFAELETAVTDLAALAQTAGAGVMDLPGEVLHLALNQRIGTCAPGGTPSGAVTFAPMSALRDLPFRLICCLGMNHDAYPATRAADEFDLMSSAARRADPDRRRDERNVFLNLLLSARETFYLSYCGRGIRDNSLQPPSVLVSDLLDYLVNAIAGNDPLRRAGARHALLTEHPLQAFSERYFCGSTRLPSFRADYCAALQARVDGSATAVEAFFRQPLSEPPDTWRVLRLERLAGFFRHPVRFLLQERLGLHLELRADSLQDEEPFVLDRRQQRLLAQTILKNLQQGLDRERVLELARLRPELAGGAAGLVDVTVAAARAETFLQKMQSLDGNEGAEVQQQQQQQLLIGDFELFCESTPVTVARQAFTRFERFDSRMALEAWLCHLVFCVSSGPGKLRPSQCLAEDRSWHFQPVADARGCLEDLLTLYWEGLQRPLPFFPNSAWEYASKGKLEEARRKWSASWSGVWSESDDPYYQLAFRDRFHDVLNDEFTVLAKRIFGPLLAAMQEGVHADFL